MIQIGQHIVGGFDGTKVTPKVKALIEKYNVGGFILFARNIESPKQVKELVFKLQSLAKTPLLIGVDQEGGRVARLKNPLTLVPPMDKVGDFYRKTKKLKKIKKLGWMMGTELRAMGFNWDFAPVVDVHSNPINPIIGDRSFSPDPKIVTQCSAAFIRGLHESLVLSCCKHFPGHGGTSTDSHLVLPIVNDTGRLLWKRDILPYRKLIERGLLYSIMTAHVLYPELDENNCATLSHDILTGLLRKRMHYKGLIVSDDLMMKAVYDKYTVAESSKLFFEAGGDIALICQNPDMQVEAIEKMKLVLKKSAALRSHFEKSARRIKKIKKEFCVKKFPPMDVIGAKEHAQLIERILLK